MILDRKILVESPSKKIHQDSRLRNPGGELARNTPPRILLKESWWMAGRIGRPYWSHISTAGKAYGRWRQPQGGPVGGGVNHRAGLQSGSQPQGGPAVEPAVEASHPGYSTIFSKSAFGCLQIGQMKSSGSSSPSHSHPQIRQRQIVLPVGVLLTGCGLVLMLFW